MKKCVEISSVIAVLFLSPTTFAQNPNTRNGRGGNTQTADPHDLSGIWLGGEGGDRNNSPETLMTPWGKAKFDSYKPSFGPRAVPGGLGNDPLSNCDPLGVPRIITAHPSGENRIQLLQTPGRLLEFIEYGHIWRDIWTDGRPLPEKPDPSWLGYAIGKWEGDEFLVNSAGFNDRTWLDSFGDPHSDEMRLEERYRRVDHNTLTIRITIHDPKAYLKDWDLPLTVYHLDPDPNSKIPEFFCVPSEVWGPQGVRANGVIETQPLIANRVFTQDNAKWLFWSAREVGVGRLRQHY